MQINKLLRTQNGPNKLSEKNRVDWPAFKQFRTIAVLKQELFIWPFDLNHTVNMKLWPIVWLRIPWCPYLNENFCKNTNSENMKFLLVGFIIFQASGNLCLEKYAYNKVVMKMSHFLLLILGLRGRFRRTW